MSATIAKWAGRPIIKPASETKILVVDDTLENLRLLTKMLESHQYTVIKAVNGKMALQMARHNAPDLILLGISMPQMNGFEVCQQLKACERTAHIPVIFISALDLIQDKVKAFEVGGQDYITKPFQELEVLARINNQLLICHQQKQLQEEIQEREQAVAEVQRLNMDLERRVKARTLELQQVLGFELALKAISDYVRDSLDQQQIFQSAVETLALTLNLWCCQAVLYNPEQTTSMIHYQWVKPEFQGTQEKTLQTTNFTEVQQQVRERMCFAFCQLQPQIIQAQFAVLICPIFNDQVMQRGIVGELWLFRDMHSSFSEMEINLVQQAANQCAIALRQAQLYEAAQTQVRELERLDQLKNDFLSTITHELRTPIASMKVVIKLLTTMMDQGQSWMEAYSESARPTHKVGQYFKVLQEECDRELALVEDLLSLQYAEAGTYSGQITPVRLQEALPHLIEPFETRTQQHQQILQVSLAPDLPVVNLDMLGLNRIITELLSNACKYTPTQGSISVSAEIIQNPTFADFPHCLQIAITNTGIEIPSEEQPRIFDKFYRIPNNDPWKYGGTGLGLALVKKLVEQMNGEIWVESTNNATRFTIQIQVSEEPATTTESEMIV